MWQHPLIHPQDKWLDHSEMTEIDPSEISGGTLSAVGIAAQRFDIHRQLSNYDTDDDNDE